MARAIIGTKLFGWCFPYMPPEQHDRCPRYSGPEEKPRECECVCHTTPKKPKKSTKRKDK